MMKEKCVVLTGAGISQDSGLKTFRDSGGLWEGHKVEDVATPEGFYRNPQLVLDFYNERRRQLKTVKPNPAHLALVALEQKYQVNIITQNVDNLHERAGSSHILHLHGELTKVRSVADESNIFFWEDDLNLTDKDQYGNLLRPHIVWFGEAVPAIEPAIELMRQADLLIIIGTSMQVYPAAGLIHYIKKDVPIYLVDPNPADIAGINTIQQKARVGVPQLVNLLLNKTD